MASLLGGRAAEALAIGDVTTGARQDHAVVTSLARKMVRELGMSDLGIVPGGSGEGAASLGDEMASRADDAVKGLIDEAAALAARILEERRDKLVEISEHLKQVETIDGEEFARLLGPDWKTIDSEAARPAV
jgi:cell division protease FtsH